MTFTTVVNMSKASFVETPDSFLGHDSDPAIFEGDAEE